MNNLINYNNYYVYVDMLKSGEMKIIYVPSDIDKDNIEDHIIGISSILKDGIETQFVAKSRIRLSWGGDIYADLSIVDYWFTLFMWTMILDTEQQIQPKHIFWSPELKRKNIKQYVDNFVLFKQNKIKFGNFVLNNVIADGLWNYSSIEQFSYFLANTINNEDDIDLMNKSKEFYDALHCDLSNVPIEDVKNYGMEITNKAIDIIKNSESILGYEHGLANSFRASEAINPRQYKEACINIGTKPNGDGGVYQTIINKSFKTGGVNDPYAYFIDSSSARQAQILSKNNVGESGDFARLLGLNNTDTILYPDPNFSCLSKHFMKFIIKTEKHLSMIKNRYYRMKPNGIDRIIDEYDTSLIGQTVYLHSPITCASHANGQGICKKCYGDLYYTNRDINVGKYAAEALSEKLTQTLLSAKHLLEVAIIAIEWSEAFRQFFMIDTDTVRLYDSLDIDLKRYYLIINTEDIEVVNDEEDTIAYDDGEFIVDEVETYNEYITEFIIKTDTGEELICNSDTQDPLYISNDFNFIIRKKAKNAGSSRIAISLDALQDIPLFYIKLNNNELSKTMDDIINIINKSSVTSTLTKEEALQNIVDLVISGGLDVDSIHLEVILANQIVNPDNIIEKPDWKQLDCKYRLLTLNQSLTNNPSIIVSLLYKDLQKVLYNPLSFSKNKPSFFDLFFCEQPQNYISDDLLTDNPNVIEHEKELKMIEIEDEEKFKYFNKR